MANELFTIDPAVAARFPDYVAVVVLVRDAPAGESDAISEGILVEAESRARARFGDRKPADDPHIAAWRAAFSAFGAKPSKYPCSAEALLRRVVRGDDLPRINRLVDVYNALSVTYALPIGGEDLDRMAGQAILRFGRPGEPFDAGEGDPVSAGEVVWSDDEGVTCRRWNWRQGLRTRLRADSRNAYFLLERLDPLPEETLQLAAGELCAAIGRWSERATITQIRLTARAAGAFDPV